MRNKLAEAKAWLSNHPQQDWKASMVEALKGASDEVLVRAFDIWWGTYSMGIQRAPSNRKIDGIQQGVREKDATAAAEAATNAVLRYLERLSAPKLAQEELEDIVREPNDVELSAIVRESMDALDGYEDRMATAYGRRMMQLSAKTQFRGYHEKIARDEIRDAVSLLMNVSDALKYTEDGLKQAEAKREFDRIWGRAKHMYQQHAGTHRTDRRKIITPWHELSEDEQAEWFALADDRVPPTWDELTPDQRADFSQRHTRQALSPAQIHAEKRARNIRRSVARQIEHARPYRVLSPQQRMSDVADMTQILSWAKEEHAKGRVTERELAVWAEHRRRAYHAYTRPFEPYEVP